MKTSKYALILVPVLLAVGCSRYTPDIYNVNKASVVTQKTGHPSTAQVGHAIDAAAISLGWRVQHVRPGYTLATLDLRNTEAVVGITYSASTYSINYVSSKNLMKNGYIHKNYNGWVQNLNKAIVTQLLAID